MIKNKELAFELFLKDMSQPAIQMAIYRSFKRYATMRDQLIEEYVKITGIPADEFQSQIAMKMVDDLVK
jgi:hypothetical protein